MDCWINGCLNDLKKLLKKINCLIINEDEAKALANEHNVIAAGEKIMDMGPRVVIIKKGASGSVMLEKSGERFLLPAFPATEVIDPTGAGDSFAGALMGYLAKAGRADFESLKTAIAYGTVVASFAIADFSLLGLSSISKADIEKRFGTLRKMTNF